MPAARRAELVADVAATSAAVARVMAELPGGGVGRAVAHVARRRGDLARRVFSRWREVVVHHGDLGLGPVPLPPDLVEAWLPRELPRLAGADGPGRAAGLGHRPGGRARWPPGRALVGTSVPRR